jgi:hypothetical protein
MNATYIPQYLVGKSPGAPSATPQRYLGKQRIFSRSSPDSATRKLDFLGEVRSAVFHKIEFGPANAIESALDIL